MQEVHKLHGYNRQFLVGIQTFNYVIKTFGQGYASILPAFIPATILSMHDIVPRTQECDETMKH